MNRRFTAAIVLIALAGAVAAASSGCCPILASSDRQTAGTGAEAPTGEAISLEEFLDADTKTGEYTSTRTDGESGDSFSTKGEFWVDGRLFRYDLYEGGKLVRSILSPDGVTAYFAQHDTQVCEPSVASVDYYLAEYSQPGEDGTEDGVDEESGATRVVFTLKKTDTMAGAANAWYVEDITYLAKDGIVIGVISRGTVPKDDGSIGPLDTMRKMFSNVRVGAPIPPETFELPYPIQASE